MGRAEIAACILALALVLALSTAPWLLANVRARSPALEPFTPNPSTVARFSEPPPYTAHEANAFVAFMQIHGSPPPETAMRHYSAIAKLKGLNREGLKKVMNADMPSLT